MKLHTYRTDIMSAEVFVSADIFVSADKKATDKADEFFGRQTNQQLLSLRWMSMSHLRRKHRFTNIGNRTDHITGQLAAIRDLIVALFW